MWEKLLEMMGSMSNVTWTKNRLSQMGLFFATTGFIPSIYKDWLGQIFYSVVNTIGLMYLLLKNLQTLQQNKHLEIEVATLLKEYLAYYPGIDNVRVPRLSPTHYSERLMYDEAKTERSARTDSELGQDYQQTAPDIFGITRYQQALPAGVFMQILSLVFTILAVQSLSQCGTQNREQCLDAETQAYLCFTVICGVITPIMHYQVAHDLRAWNNRLLEVRRGIEEKFSSQRKVVIESLAKLSDRTNSAKKSFALNVDALPEPAGNILLGISQIQSRVDQITQAHKERRLHMAEVIGNTTRLLKVEKAENSKVLKELLEKIVELVSIKEIIQETTSTLREQLKEAKSRREVAEKQLTEASSRLATAIKQRPNMSEQLPPSLLGRIAFLQEILNQVSSEA